MARSSATADAGVSRPTALPIRACLVGYEESMMATRLALFGVLARRAWRTAKARRRTSALQRGIGGYAALSVVLAGMPNFDTEITLTWSSRRQAGPNRSEE